MKKYVAVNFKDLAGQNPVVFETLKEANKCAEDMWDHLTQHEKEECHYYVAEVTENDLIYEGDWTQFDDYNQGMGFFDSDEIGMYYVRFEGGESREFPGKGVDIMYTKIWDDDDEVIELYSEAENPTWDEEDECFEDELYNYDTLKDDILSQAEEAGLHPSKLKF